MAVCAFALRSAILLFICACLREASVTSAFSLQNSLLQDKLTEQLDDAGNYTLSWTINEETKVITFEIEAVTLGYVGLGISPTGKMTGADIFVGGVYPNGTGYSGDYHATQNGQPIPDDHNDWNLEEVRENGTHTYIRVNRLLDTCDNQDYPISEENTARIIYAMGASDEFFYHVENRGTKSVNLIEVPTPDLDVSKMSKWQVFVEMEMPATDTTYWCTIQRGPPITEKHHVVGFDVFLDGPTARKHSHHFIVTKCHAPPGANATEIFEPYVNTGEECYVNHEVPVMQYCKQYLFVWAVGGKRTVFPLDIGYAIGDSDQDSYYMLETHFDNPEKLSNLTFKSGIDIYYTKQLRKIEASMLAVGHETIPTMIVPPNQTEFVITGHCSPKCSSNFPETGLHVFNVLLHSHLSGRKLKLRHFRGDAELPWLSYDDTYDFDFQQNKPLRNEITLMPGDQLTYECVYDTTWKNGEVVLGGLSSREEMCLAFLWVYSTGPTVTPFDLCGSIYTLDKVESDFCMNLTFDEKDVLMIVDPEQYRGQRFEDYLNWNFTWTATFVAEQQQKYRYGVLDSFCADRGGDWFDLSEDKYPDVADFKPRDQCSDDSTTDSTTDSAANFVNFKCGLIIALLASALLNL